MRIQKDYWKLDDLEEISIYDISEKELFKYVEPVTEIPPIPFKSTLRSLPCDMDVFIPYNDGEDFIIQMLGLTALERGNIRSKDVEGRLLSECSPGFHSIFHKAFYDVYKTQKTKKFRINYYENDKLARLANVKILNDMGKIILISELKYTNESKFLEEDDLKNYDENKANLIEYFSQTGSYYKINDKYS